MKSTTTKKVLSLLIFLTSFTIYCQNSKLEIKSVSAGFGLIKSTSMTSAGGINFTLDLTTNLDNNLFSIYINAGSEIGLLDYSENYTEYNVTYGRELKVNNWLKIESHLGFGYFDYRTKSRLSNFEQIKKSTVGIPLRVKFIFYTAEHFGLGINPNANLNSLVNTYSGNLFLQYKF